MGERSLKDGHGTGGSVSGVVITLAEGPAAQAAVRLLAADGRFTLGEQFGRSIAAVLEVGTDDEAELTFRWLMDLPGVARAAVTYVHLAGC